MGNFAPTTYSAQGSFFDSVGSFAPTTYSKGYMMILLFICLFKDEFVPFLVCRCPQSFAIFGVQMPTVIIDKVITFHINTVKFDGVVKVWVGFLPTMYGKG